ncbi:hypothetical protein ABIB35_003109 [Arthrobacter sp. UYP6]|uniref:DUF6395 domain-containing protein n=1 Tax=Arthrobacter sp. UYP6 TaxID=1756378 RepID=UPI0033909841
MQITMSQVNADLIMSAELSEGDRELAGKAALVSKKATFKLPDGFSIFNTHPDLRALAALLTFYPWIGNRLDLSFAVSKEFAEAVKVAARIDVTNQSADIPKRTPGEGSHPGLSFSGGVDSMGALALMPDDTVPVFSLRTSPPEGGRSLYKPDVALHAIAEMRKAGRSVHIVESDHEWVRGPVGFSVDPAPAIALILLADEFNLDAITFGTIAESAYSTGAGKWSEYKLRTPYTRWKTLFDAVALDTYNATAGVSEIGTSTIVRTSEFGHLAQSCIRGIPGHPCRACVKCFRKSLITASLTGEWPDEIEVARLMANRTIKGFLENAPIRFEIILASVMASYSGTDPLLLRLQSRVGSLVQDVSFTGTWYGPAMDLVPEKYRAGTIEAANRYLPQMTEEQEEAFRNYDIAPFLEANKQGTEEFLKTVEENALAPVKTV